jgi:hypothetical protein
MRDVFVTLLQTGEAHVESKDSLQNAILGCGYPFAMTVFMFLKKEFWR